MKVKEIISKTRWIPNQNAAQAAPRFSIFLPTFRRAKSGHLERAIQSVLGQSFRDLELIIIDDASTDGSHEIIKEFMTIDRRVHMLHHPVNVGLPAIACYEAYLKSRGMYLGFCFDDTEMARDALKETNDFLKKTSAKVVYGYIKYDELVSGGKVVTHELGRCVTSQQTLTETNYIPNLGVVLHRDVPKEAGFLDPHFAVARVCDWDYWRRLSKKYELRRMDVFMGAEYGLVTGNSLGLTYPMSSHLNAEWGDVSRDDLLTPGNYEEYDVQTSPPLSYPSMLALQELHQFYKQKFWFNDQTDFSSLTLRQKRGRIFVVGSEISASVNLPFQNLTNDYFRLCSHHLDPAELSLAQAVVFSRTILHPWADKYIEAARAIRVPMYYYLDDNFEVLRPMFDQLKDYTVENLRKRLDGFSGIMVPNQELANYCMEHQLHDTVMLTPPVVGERSWHDHPTIPPKPANAVRLCFMGGDHRTGYFEEFVVPAINKLSETRKVELVLVGKHQTSDRSLPKVKLYRLPFDVSYDLTVGRLIHAQIDVLIHAGSASLGNQYKTPNALINAWELGAIPVVAKQPPFLQVEEKGIGFIADWRDSNSWFEKITEALSDESSTITRDKLAEFITTQYDGSVTKANIERMLDQQMPLGFATIDLRNKRYATQLRQGAVVLEKSIVHTFTRTNSPSFACNGFAKLKGKSTVHYEIVAEEDGLNGLNFRIGTFAAHPQGVLEVSIRSSKGMSIEVKEFDLSDIQDNQIVRFDFSPLAQSAGKTFRVAFNYYPIGRGKLAIYEVNQNAKGITRLLRRTGVIRAGNRLACNLLYANQAA